VLYIDNNGTFQQQQQKGNFHSGQLKKKQFFQLFCVFFSFLFTT